MGGLQDYNMQRMKRKTLEEEEHVGLLDHEDEEEKGQEVVGDAAHRHQHRRRRSQPFTVRVRSTSCCKFSVKAIGIVLLLALVVHIIVALRKHASPEPPLAILRPEEDYILDPDWDLNAAPTTREYDWTIADHVLNPDGVYRPMMLINAQFPGPLIEVNEGDEIVVHVHNAATNATSIHWHGLFQNGTNWMDGTVGITQCPIAPSHSFTYRFNVSGQTGTYWYHSHMAMQISDGLVGPIVIHARGDEEKAMQKVAYAQDRVVMVSDHYYETSSTLLMQYLAPDRENEEPVPQSALINGRGLRDCADLPGRECSSSGRSNALLELSAEQGTRLRFINVGAFAEFQIQIDEHEFQVTEVDGVDVHPQSIHRLNINPAQRYSIIVTSPTSPKDQYWLRARMVTHCFAYEEPEMKAEVRGVIRYADSFDHSSEPQSKDWPEVIEVECRDLDTSALEPVRIVAAPAHADDQVFLRSSFQIGDWRLSRGFLNDSSYRSNMTHPTLSTFISAVARGDKEQTSSFSVPFGRNTALDSPTGQTLVYQTIGIRTIDILVQNFDDGNHPFHLHGHAFFLLASGHAYPPEDIYTNLNLTNPLRRDTASVEAYGWTLIRFVADNPGVWPFHCHIGWHSEAGLLMQFLTKAEEVAEWKVPEDVETLCQIEGLTKGAGPEDKIWVGNFG